MNPSYLWPPIVLKCVAKTGAEQWRVAVRASVVANVVLVRVADASPAATPQKNVDVIVLEMGLVVVWE